MNICLQGLFQLRKTENYLNISEIIIQYLIPKKSIIFINLKEKNALNNI
jgi:hypothetical protein